MIPSGFIENLTKVLIDRLPGVNPSYARMCAEILLAGCSFKISHYNRIGRMGLGLWGLVITRSGEWKTVPIRNYIIPILRSVESRLPSHGLVKRIAVPSRFSPEGLIEFMNLHKETRYNEETGEEEEMLCICNEGLMVRDEFTGMMRGVKTKDWMSDVSELLSEVYDMSVQPYYTKKDKLQDVPYCNVSFLMATTPYFYSLLDETFFTQGLGNRMDYILFEPPKEPRKVTPDDFFGIEDRSEVSRIIKSFADDLLKLLNSNIRFVGIDPEVAELWTDYRNDIERRKRQLSGHGLDVLKWAYMSRQAEKALRRAGVYCVSRAIYSPLMLRSDTIVVNEQDMRLAIERQEEHYRHFEQLLREWMKSPEPRSRKSTDVADLERMIAIIEDRPHKMITNQQWLKESGYGFQNKFYYLKGVLLARGDVRELTPEEIGRLNKDQLESLGKITPKTKVYVLNR